MARTTFACAVVALVALTAGCSMCAHPYDYCGPTFTGEGCQPCMPNARACSILSPGGTPCCGSPMGPPMMVSVSDAEMVGPAPGVGLPIEMAATAQPQRQTARPPRRVR